MAERALAPRGGAHAPIEAQTISWVREAARTPEGMAAIAEAYRTDINVASVIFSTFHPLLGLSKDAHGKVCANIIDTHVPKAAAKMREGQELSNAVSRYAGVEAAVHRSFYSASVVTRAEATRVEV